MLSRVGEPDSCADGKIVHRGDALNWRLAATPAIPALYADPQLSQREACAGQHQKLHEVPALDVEILRPVDGEVLPPGRLCVGRREVRRDRDLLALECGCVEARGGCTRETFTSWRVDCGIDRATWIGTDVGHRYT